MSPALQLDWSVHHRLDRTIILCFHHHVLGEDMDLTAAPAASRSVAALFEGLLSGRAPILRGRAGPAPHEWSLSENGWTPKNTIVEAGNSSSKAFFMGYVSLRESAGLIVVECKCNRFSLANLIRESRSCRVYWDFTCKPRSTQKKVCGHQGLPSPRHSYHPKRRCCHPLY